MNAGCNAILSFVIFEIAIVREYSFDFTFITCRHHTMHDYLLMQLEATYMSDASVTHIGENSREQIAFKLFEIIARVEKKSITGSEQSELKSGWTKADKNYVLSTYAECIDTVVNRFYEVK